MSSLTPKPDQKASILLLCENEKFANLDRRSLRAAGYGNTRVMESGIDAARILAGLDKPLDGFYPDIVVCLNQLSDMDGEQFCAIIRQHPLLLGLPILLIMPNDNEAGQLRALGCGASALLGRPYSVDTLKSLLAQLGKGIEAQRKLRKANQDADTSSFDEALATYGVLLRSERKPEDYFKVGMRCLAENRWQLAIAAFERALRDAQIKAEAELGIAAAFKGKGDMARSKAWLARATESFLQARRWNRARSAYARLLQNDPSAKNPFLAEAHKLIHQQNYEEAATALVYSLGFISKKSAGERYARVCMSADDPDKMLEALKERLNSDGKGQYTFLSDEIRQSLNIMLKQKQERQKQNSAERKWQLAHALGLLPENKPATEKTKSGSLLVEMASQSRPPLEKTVASFGEGEIDEKFAPAATTRKTKKIETEAGPVVTREFGRKENLNEKEEDFFSDNSKLNVLFSVVKLTWKLSRSSRKNT